MRCWNCNKDVPKTAKICQHCEADLSETPTEDEMNAAREVLGQMDPKVIEELHQAMLNSATAEEFADAIFVGDCPKCNSSNTGNCEKDPDIDCLLVGRCYDCGQLWCTECEKLLTREAPTCKCWDEE